MCSDVGSQFCWDTTSSSRIGVNKKYKNSISFIRSSSKSVNGLLLVGREFNFRCIHRSKFPSLEREKRSRPEDRHSERRTESFRRTMGDIRLTSGLVKDIQLLTGLFLVIGML